MRAWVLASFALLAASPAQAASPEVWKHWSDGQAELSGYRLVQPRYGQLRQGTVVLIFVTEPFSRSARVKADPGQHPDSDVSTVMKLNVVKDFQTGLYDYNVMSSVFVPLDEKAGTSALKLSFSSQEWCGHLYEELLVEEQKIRQHRASYFDGESIPEGTLPRPAGGLLAEELMIQVRDLPGPFLAPGEVKTLPVLSSVERTRFLHRPLAWRTGRVERTKDSRAWTVPAGRFVVDTFTADLGQGERYLYFVEHAFPHRLIGWEGPDGERAELTGSARLAYWKLNQEGGEKYLEQLGLPVPKAPAPGP